MEHPGPGSARPRGAAGPPPSSVRIALVVLAAILIIYCLSRCLGGGRDGFASQRAQEVYQASQELFGRTGGNASYSEFKTAVPGTVDAVTHADARRLWKGGGLSPEAVEKIL